MPNSEQTTFIWTLAVYLDTRQIHGLDQTGCDYT